MRIITLFSLIAFTLAACGTNSKSKWTTIQLVQDSPILVDINLGDSAKGAGDELAFEAKLRDTSNKEVGHLLGMLVTFELPAEDGIGNTKMEERMGTLSYHLGEDDDIMVQGITSYSPNQQIMEVNIPQLRAVIGGTGKYKGARGQVTVVRKEDGKYHHTLELIVED